jgi:single-strand DNA-binding protein
MNSVNIAILTGRLGDVPTIRQAGDIEVASFSLATANSWYSDKKQNDDGTTGGWESKTTWHRITYWRPIKSLKEAQKGRMVHVQGRYESNSWQDRNTGETRYSMEVIADKCWVLPEGKGRAFQTEPEKEAKKSSTAGAPQTGTPQQTSNEMPVDDSGFPEEGPDGLPF